MHQAATSTATNNGTHASIPIESGHAGAQAILVPQTSGRGSPAVLHVGNGAMTPIVGADLARVLEHMFLLRPRPKVARPHAPLAKYRRRRPAGRARASRRTRRARPSLSTRSDDPAPEPSPRRGAVDTCRLGGRFTANAREVSA